VLLRSLDSTQLLQAALAYSTLGRVGSWTVLRWRPAGGLFTKPFGSSGLNILSGGVRQASVHRLGARPRAANGPNLTW
jgi:hypothetical protein